MFESCRDRQRRWTEIVAKLQPNDSAAAMLAKLLPPDHEARQEEDRRLRALLTETDFASLLSPRTTRQAKTTAHTRQHWAAAAFGGSDRAGQSALQLAALARSTGSGNKDRGIFATARGELADGRGSDRHSGADRARTQEAAFARPKSNESKRYFCYFFCTSVHFRKSIFIV